MSSATATRREARLHYVKDDTARSLGLSPGVRVNKCKDITVNFRVNRILSRRLSARAAGCRSSTMNFAPSVARAFACVARCALFRTRGRSEERGKKGGRSRCVSASGKDERYVRSHVNCPRRISAQLRSD